MCHSLSVASDVALGMERRLVFSLLKPAVRAAAHFRVPIRALVELVRLAYLEVLARDEGLSKADIAARFGQSDRHIRSLASRLESDFFAPEEIGLARTIEAALGPEGTPRDEVYRRFSQWSTEEVDRALAELIRDGRTVERDGRLSLTSRYVILRSDKFPHRIDALNHFLDGAYAAVLHRLVYDDRKTSMIKTLSFSAIPEELAALAARLEAHLRRDVSELDEHAAFEGRTESRFTMSIVLSPAADATPASEE
jgi:hypothetical protein